MVVGIFMHVPWLLGIVVLFAFEFIEGNTVPRLYFMRLRRITQEALQTGTITPELEKARGEGIPTFTPAHPILDSRAWRYPASELDAVYCWHRRGYCRRNGADALYPQAVPMGRGKTGDLTNPSTSAQICCALLAPVLDDVRALSRACSTWLLTTHRQGVTK
jgi:hypothetical protein